MSMNCDALLEKAKKGQTLTDEELSWARQALVAPREACDPYTAIHVLWKTRDRRSRAQIASAVTSADEMVRRIALQALAELWPSEDIHDIAIQLMNQDESKYVRMAAATVVGDLGASLPQRAPRAAFELLKALEASNAPKGPEWESYYEGLLNLLRVPVSARPPATAPLNPRDIDPAVLAAARALAANAAWTDKPPGRQGRSTNDDRRGK
jgi:HEAT repeat protein